MGEEIKKEFGLSTWSVNNRKTVFLVLMIIVLGGVMAYKSMPKENFPELQIPEIYVGIAKPGSSPSYMSEKITQAIEKEIATIKYVDEIKSNSTHGFTTIQTKFDFKIDASEALTKVKDAVDQARSKSDFPELPVEPTIFELDPSQFPIMNINLRGANAKLLKDIAEELEDRIEDLPEINEVDIRGVQKQEMRIEVDRLKAEAVNVAINDIESAIQGENTTISGGEIRMDGLLKTVMIDGEFQDAQELSNIIVKQDDFMPVHLRDIAEVYFGNADTTSYAREFGTPVVMLDVKKQGGENLIEAAKKIKAIVEEAKADNTIPESVTVSITNDQSTQTEDMVANLENSIIFGIILVTIVLLFFLGSRNALFVGIAIPLSMLMSFLILDAMEVTLNVMVLFSLVLALGMLVDNGIVVVENIYRLMDEGLDSFSAAKQGVGEVAWPIIASTATTLAAFVPLALWPGIFGEFMKYLPITLMIVLGSSLFVALVINPVLTALYMKVGEPKVNKTKSSIIALVFIIIGVGVVLFLEQIALGNIIALIGILIILNVFLFSPGTTFFQGRVIPKMEQVYRKFLTFAVQGKKPMAFILGTFVLLGLSVWLISVFQPKIEFFPENQPKYANIFISHPIGTDIRVTNETTLAVEDAVNEILAPYLADTLGKIKDAHIIQSIISQVGEGTGDPSQGVSMEKTPHKGRITINFAEFEFRDSINTTGYLLRKLQNELKGRFTAEVQLSIEKNSEGPPQEPPINLEMTGRIDYKDLIFVATEVKSYLDRKGIPGVEELKLNVEATRPEIPIEVDREQVRKLNASTSQVGMAIRKALLGQEVGTYTMDEENYDIVIRFQESDRFDLNSLLDQKLIFRNNTGKQLNIPIRSVVKDPKENISYTGVVRKNQVPLVVVSSNVIEGFNANEVVEELKGVMEDYAREGTIPKDVDFKFTGQQEEQEKELAFLSQALLVAVFMILLIIVTQFNSYSTPAIILFAVLLSLIGVFLGLVISGQTFVIIMTMIGIISLAGVVVNNAIVLIDYTNLIRKERREELGLTEDELLPYEEVVKATIKGGETRLRPVLLTAITTVLGLIPLAVGFNIDFFKLITEYDPNIFIGGDNNMFFSPMSWTIIYGLTFATFLTLVIVPAMYLLLYRFKIWLYKLLGWKLRSTI